MFSKTLNSTLRCRFNCKYLSTSAVRPVYSTEKETHFGFETVSEATKAKKVKAVFENVADQYDLMNDCMSAGVWKETAQESFVKLLRDSTFVRLGEPSGKIVEGVVHHIVEDDLYIDFGGKFDSVCLRPLENGPAYRLGTKVRVLLRDTELSTRFLGASTDLTILEADATLLGLLRESAF